ncbi:hypothetical protein TREVI0001_1619 [Treponema vincentii ATCC 35580]|uniref:Uncharacterized protein n=1 Tax=Treponema vincentii ATCC 35580 TaxID=596324 RepID=C8PNB2_9SPIR|nr:hypothetical protein TREVI0001_1619 [Treponema vincentii ATCC 35580]
MPELFLTAFLYLKPGQHSSILLYVALCSRRYLCYSKMWCGSFY